LVSAGKNYSLRLSSLMKAASEARSGAEIIKIEAVTAVFFIFLAAVSGAWAILLAIPVMAAAPFAYLSYKRKKYLEACVEALPLFLESVVSSLRAGTSLAAAFKTYAERDSGPLGAEVFVILKKTGLGMDLKEAVREFGNIIPSADAKIASFALCTALESGGNISETLETILDTIRKRREIGREVKALTSQGVLSGIIVGLLPVFLLVAVSFIDPEFTAPLFNTTEGRAILAAAFVMEIMGAFFIKKIVDVA
ncbi:MAG TPA: type II secretion system F family protein, partial [Candidatus Goldiibacteriota bacterium]|nr:type II secretion system F family protein [Candidatus Goldiibacteriota bacterium]